jgi:diguanylate cyclase (GGDEF)-like protein
MKELDHEKCLRLMTEILGLLKSKNQYEEVFHFVVDRIVRLFHCQTCAIILIDPRTEYLRVENSFGLSLTFRKEFQRKLATGAIGQLLWTGKRILIPDSAADSGLASEVQLEQPFGSCVCLQIAVNHRTIGYLHVDTAEPQALDETTLPVLQNLADLAGIAYLKARLMEDNMRLDRIDHETELEKYSPFLERLGEHIERAAQSNEPFALLISDVDNFKSTALTYGYDASHRMLGEMASVIKGQLRTTDAVGRYGFDEFILLRTNVQPADATDFARELGKAVAGTAYTADGIASSVSTGVAMYPEHGTTVEELVLAAKYATFEAQRSGRNSVVLFSKD